MPSRSAQSLTVSAVEVEQLEHGDEQRRAGGEQLGPPLLLEAGQPPALRGLRRHDALVQRFDLGARRRATRSCSTAACVSPDRSATAMRTRSLSVPLVPTAMPR